MNAYGGDLNANCRKAVVLAAGFGTRLRPFTSAVPKPLLPVWGEPMLARVVDWLRSCGVEEIAVNCHHLHSQVEDWCAKNGCRAVFEPEILGTGGVLNPLRDWLAGDDFWLVNGDIVFENVPLAEIREGVRRAPRGGVGVVGCCLVTEDGPRTIEVEPDGNLVTCWHSQDPGWRGTWTYCGVSLLKAKILDYVKRDGFSSIVEAYEAAMMDGLFMKAVTSGDLLWTDAGTVESYIALNQDGNDNAFAEIPQVRAVCDAQTAGAAVEFMGARGSDRAFFKCADRYIILYDDEKRGENAKYAGHARWLKAQGIAVPGVLADAPAMKAMALENAGSEDLCARSRHRGEDRLYDYVAVVEELAKFNSLDASALSLEPAFDAALYKWERDLFAEHCLGTRFHMEPPGAVMKELEAVAERLLAEPPALVHRDFQSTNVVFGIRGTGDGEQGTARDTFSIIDFQGMRIGAAAYDLASLLYDPYVDLRDGERRGLAALYAKKAHRPDIAEVLPFAAVERLVQALGAFGRLASVGKPEFGKFVAPALENLLAAADEAGLDAVGALAEELISRERGEPGAGNAGRGRGGHAHCHCTCKSDGRAE